MKRFILAFVLIFTLLVCTLNPVLAKGRKWISSQLTQPNPPQQASTSFSLGTWLWNSWLIVSSKDSIMDYLISYGYTELYLQIDSSIQARYYKDFISSASQKGIKVYALSGSHKWIWQNNRAEFYNFISWVESYNKEALPQERFEGIHLDVEPYLTAEWNTDRSYAILSYQNFVEDAVLQGTRLNLPVVFDIPFWFDEIFYSNEYGSGNLANFVISKASWTNIMAYRDKSNDIIAISKVEADLSKALGKRLVISVEIQASSEGDFVTFYEEGFSYMYDELSKVQNYYITNGYNNTSFAVHHLGNIINMK